MLLSAGNLSTEMKSLPTIVQAGAGRFNRDSSGCNAYLLSSAAISAMIHSLPLESGNAIFIGSDLRVGERNEA
jgi:hypothetical protein